MLALLAAFAHGMVSPPGKQEVIIFDAPGEPLTATGVPEAPVVPHTTDSNSLETRQHEAEAAQRQAENTIKRQTDEMQAENDKVKYDEDAVSSFKMPKADWWATGEDAPGAQVPVPVAEAPAADQMPVPESTKEAEQRQRKLEEDMEEDKKRMDAAEAERAEAEKARLDEEEMARKEAEEKTRADVEGRYDDELSPAERQQRQLEEAQHEAEKAAEEETAKAEKASEQAKEQVAEREAAKGRKQAEMEKEAEMEAERAEKVAEAEADDKPSSLEDRQHEAEAAQREAEAAIKEQADAMEAEKEKIKNDEEAVLKDENSVKSLANPDDSGTPVPDYTSDAEEAQRKLEEEENARAEAEAQRLDEEEKARLEAEEKAREDNDYILNPDEVSQRKLESDRQTAQREAQKEAQASEAARIEAEKKRFEEDEARRKASEEAASDAMQSRIESERDEQKKMEESMAPSGVNPFGDNPFGDLQGTEAHSQEQEQGQEQEQEQGQEQGQEQENDHGRVQGEHHVVRMVRDQFYNAVPSNDLTKAGLMVHCFDETEEQPGLFKPCTSDWCAKKHFDTWWSASIINSQQPDAFGDAGLLLSGSRNMINCSFYEDVGTMDSGCRKKSKKDNTTKFQRNELEKMLEGSMSSGMYGYNEVLVDSKKFMSQLPNSITAVVYGLKGMDTWGQVQATKVYVNILDAFGLTEDDSIRLIKISYDRFESMYNRSNVNWSFTDESKGARKFLEGHPYDTARSEWVQKHPYVQEQPERARELLGAAQKEAEVLERQAFERSQQRRLEAARDAWPNESGAPKSSQHLKHKKHAMRALSKIQADYGLSRNGQLKQSSKTTISAKTQAAVNALGAMRTEYARISAFETRGADDGQRRPSPRS